MLVSYTFNQQLVLIASQIPSPRWTITKQSIGWVSYAVKGQTVFFKIPHSLSLAIFDCCGCATIERTMGGFDAPLPHCGPHIFLRRVLVSAEGQSDSVHNPVQTCRSSMVPRAIVPSPGVSGDVGIQKFRVKILVSEIQSLQQLGNFLDFMGIRKHPVK